MSKSNDQTNFNNCDTSSLFQSVADSMKTACNELENANDHMSMSIPFNNEHFWTTLRMCSSKVSNEVTKLSLIYSKDPIPPREEAQELLNSLEAAYVDLLTTFYLLPKEMGTTLYTKVKNVVMCLVKTVATFVLSLKETGAEAQKDRLSQTGMVWEACEAFESLPENNVQALSRLFRIEEALVVDALMEIEEEVKSRSLIPTQADLDVDLSDSWNSSDLALISPGIGLIKTARAILKKVSQVVNSQAKCDTVEQISELDKLAGVITKFSPAVDDLIESMYPPLTRDNLTTTAKVVVAKLDNTLKMVQESHYVIESNQEWIDFLVKALEHNDTKLQQLLMQS